MLTDDAPWLTPREVALVLRVSISSVRGMIRAGRLPARRLRGSRLLRVARADVEALLEPLHRESTGPEREGGV